MKEKKMKQYKVYSCNGAGDEVIGYVLMPDYEKLLEKCEDLEDKLYSIMVEKEDNSNQ